RGAGEDLRQRQPLERHLHDAHAREMSEDAAPRVHRRDRGVVRQGDAERLGPPLTAIAGTSQLAAPISSAGVVLSQPTISTTASIGLPRIASSTSMLARLRVNIAVGRRFDSPLLKTGNSTG